MDVLNASQNFSENLSQLNHYPPTTVRVLWLIGIFTSVLGLILQMFLLCVLPKCRRYDEFALFQLTIVRVLNTTGEHVLIFNVLSVPYHFVIFWNFYTDLSLACWMFLFTKNLFDRIVLVFVNNDRHRLSIDFTVTWLVPVPLALVAPYAFSTAYYITFCAIKLIITSVNVRSFKKSKLSRQTAFRSFIRSKVMRGLHTHTHTYTHTHTHKHTHTLTRTHIQTRTHARKHAGGVSERERVRF
ncbi:hypothetical protein EVAR_24673_1 [Eumeta japonica]|uniref:G-protein coupled receptors family 1 profile domain-containing protein n=1 Tax=Eumeta variegata TaxID=151549 RepID=A0A4C1WDB9_EUMVA|nr:hypothetical protein EVAR_24673_1 [Eumeta japonica]